MYISSINLVLIKQYKGKEIILKVIKWNSPFKTYPGFRYEKRHSAFKASFSYSASTV